MRESTEEKTPQQDSNTLGKAETASQLFLKDHPLRMQAIEKPFESGTSCANRQPGLLINISFVRSANVVIFSYGNGPPQTFGKVGSASRLKQDFAITKQDK